MRGLGAFADTAGGCTDGPAAVPFHLFLSGIEHHAFSSLFPLRPAIAPGPGRWRALAVRAAGRLRRRRRRADKPAPTPVTPSASYASGTIDGFGSILVNGVRYDERQARITDGDGVLLASDALKLGMAVHVTADPVTTGSDGVARAMARQILVRSDLEGPLSAVVGDRLTVLGQTVIVDAATVFEDGRAAALQVGRVLEVHGLRDAQGRILASRIEIEDDADEPWRLRAPVDAVDMSRRTLRIGEAVVNWSGVQVAAALAAGDVVSLRLARQPDAAGLWVATALSVQRPTLPEQAGVEADVTGHITRMDSPTRFVVDGLSVDAGSAARLPAGLAVGDLVEVEGMFQDGVLRASEVERKLRLDSDDGFEIEGRITAVDSLAGIFELRGVRVDYRNARFEDGSAAQIAVGRVVEVKGRLSVDGAMVVATEVEFD